MQYAILMIIFIIVAVTVDIVGLEKSFVNVTDALILRKTLTIRTLK
jgi:hypothetical protein